MIKKIPLTGLFLFCFIPSFLAGQGYSYVNYNIKEGLAGSMVYCMVQDHDGFMWFGTETGLSRFDGKHFVNFTTLDGLPDNEIIRLFVDSKNRIWIMPFQNKACYYFKGKLYSEQNDSLLKKIPYMGGVVGIVENKEKEVAIVQAKGTTIITPDNSIIYISPPPGLLNINMAGLSFDSSIQVNILEHEKSLVQFFNIEKHKLVHYKNFEFRLLSVNGIYLSKDLRVLQNHPDSLLFFTGNEKFSVHIEPDFLNMSRLNDSLLAIASQKHTEIFNIRQRRPDGFFMEHENISNVLEDREGNLWFASMGNGVYRLASRKYNAATLKVNGNFQPVHAISKMNGSLLIGASNFSLWKLDLATNKLDRSVLIEGASQGRILVIDAVGKDKAIIGTDGGVFTLENGRATFIPPPFAVKDIVIDGDSVLVGHNMGAEWLYLRTKARKPMEFLTRTTAILRRNDSLFCGTLKGLFIRLPDRRQIDSPGKTNSALAGRISAIKEASDGTIWIGTYGNGVVGLRNGQYFFINRDSGLTSNIVRAIYPDGQAIWVGTDKGLNKVALANGRYNITRYTNADGIISDIINTLYVDSGTIYVGTPAGLTWFKEDDVFTNSMCVLKLTGIRSDKQPWVADSSDLRFEHYDSDIRFEFTGISFKSAGEINYRYRLLGLDGDWHTTTDNFLNYPTLPSGEYVLELQAINKFGVKSDMMRIEFTIGYLLWERTWVRILAVIFLASLLWIFVSWRIRSIRRQADLKTETNRKISELEQMALKSQMNPHFIFNSLNSIQHYMFDKDVESANRFITEFSRLIRLTLEFSSKTKISLEDEIRFLATFLELETRRFEGKFKYRIDVDAQLEPAHIFIPPMILQPYIENSIRHGIRYREDNNGMVKLDFNTDGDNLFISLEDNGVGRERSKLLKGQNNIEYQSKGMNLTARRIEMINKSSTFPISIDISDIQSGGEVAGTKVMIRIPLPK